MKRAIVFAGIAALILMAGSGSAQQCSYPPGGSDLYFYDYIRNGAPNTYQGVQECWTQSGNGTISMEDTAGCLYPQQPQAWSFVGWSPKVSQSVYIPNPGETGYASSSTTWAVDVDVEFVAVSHDWYHQFWVDVYADGQYVGTPVSRVGAYGSICGTLEGMFYGNFNGKTMTVVLNATVLDSRDAVRAREVRLRQQLYGP